ncbi:hypothetical protein [Polaromonas sp.]|uniref:hypothetical protein n=2 Tax=Polaromonas TaxID=52972 RepID=UPI002C31E96E|nr:hypothetical protein [Polaromonas sp.]HQS00792.1 hypothetical protein [Polaromonas sp.]HQS38973.1 hypothetical protein [Polaromonas sp.]HQT09537.1 hypothetical protein [Polaromonas sp.]
MQEPTAIAVRPGSGLMAQAQRLPAMTEDAIAKVRSLQEVSLALCEQVEFPTEHLIHAGMYIRTLHMKADQVLTGALLKVPTVLVVSGDCAVFIGEETIELRGYSVLPGSAGRIQAFLAHTDVSMSMSFPTKAKTVAEAEREFTDDYELLMTNRQADVKTLITGE